MVKTRQERTERPPLKKRIRAKESLSSKKTYNKKLSVLLEGVCLVNNHFYLPTDHPPTVLDVLRFVISRTGSHIPKKQRKLTREATILCAQELKRVWTNFGPKRDFPSDKSVADRVQVFLKRNYMLQKRRHWDSFVLNPMLFEHEFEKFSSPIFEIWANGNVRKEITARDIDYGFHYRIRNCDALSVSSFSELFTVNTDIADWLGACEDLGSPGGLSGVDQHSPELADDADAVKYVFYDVDKRDINIYGSEFEFCSDCPHSCCSCCKERRKGPPCKGIDVSTQTSLDIPIDFVIPRHIDIKALVTERLLREKEEKLELGFYKLEHV